MAVIRIVVVDEGLGISPDSVGPGVVLPSRVRLVCAEHGHCDCAARERRQVIDRP